MELINYSLALLIVYLSPIIGNVLAFIAKEELDPGRKYFVIMRRVFFLLSIAIVFYGYKVNIILIAAVVLVLGGISWLRHIRSLYLYPLLAVAFYLSSGNMAYFTIEACLIFLYGLPVGSMFVEKRLKQSKIKVIGLSLLNNLSFLVIGLLMFFISF